jgi:hypothetical protein
MSKTPAKVGKQLAPRPKAKSHGGGAVGLVIAATVLLLTGCGFLLTGTTDPAQVQPIMQSTNARGCIYTRASAAPWAQVTTILVGTWGQDPPPYQACWQGLPAGIQ